MWTSYAQCNPQRQVLRVSRVMKLLKTGCVAGCDWTANGRRSRHNGRRGLRYGTQQRLQTVLRSIDEQKLVGMLIGESAIVHEETLKIP